MVTEVEMREFFAKVVDQVNDLSAQAGLVSGLQQQVNDLRERINGLEQANYSLQQSLNDANGRVESLTREVGTHQEAARVANEHVNALRETIVQRDTKVYELEGNIRAETDAHRITRADLDDARRATQEWESKYNQTSDSLRAITDDRDHLVVLKGDLERENSDLRAKLDRIGAMFQSNVAPFPSAQVG